MRAGFSGSSGALADALSVSLADALDADLAAADADLVARYPGPPATRHPVRTLYLPAERVRAGESVRRCGVRATRPRGDDDEARTHSEAAALHSPVEDLRIDFEDGFTQRGVPAGDRGREEDAHVSRVLADSSAARTAAAVRGPTSSSSLSSSPVSPLPPFWGLRFGSLDPATRRRGIRTLTRVVRGLAAEGGLLCHLPGGFRPTLPKVASVDQVHVMVRMCRELEQACGLAERSIGFEIQVETPQSNCGPDGSALIASFEHIEVRSIGPHDAADGWYSTSSRF